MGTFFLSASVFYFLQLMGFMGFGFMFTFALREQLH